ncbi:SDR family NAD(P)-dependent oxidoreductase [Curtobacterium sp. 18060]|uniref:SDR family NAD(P)-dependent oxidoreductase n=1 Tax=Curtobacterium sp. 18060 TaxID=2681408 RepID=UPI0013575E4A|nr:SDR family NAD(P)-dependent oxidoreductase [Curtobacterium sp. 18060]
MIPNVKVSGATPLTGKVAVVTGASAGIGAAAAARLAQSGAHVVVVGRNQSKTEGVAAAIGGSPLLVDMSSLDDVRRLGADLRANYPRIDLLLNNAGGISAKQHRTPDGFERTFQVNYLAPFLLTHLLRESLGRAVNSARVINTGSSQYRRGRISSESFSQLPGRYSSMRAYGSSKLALMLFTAELVRRGGGIYSSVVHPGGVATEVARENRLQRALMGSPLLKRLILTPAQGAEPLVSLATVPSLSAWNGMYFHRFTPRAAGVMSDTDAAEGLWKRTMRELDLTEE